VHTPENALSCRPPPSSNITISYLFILRAFKVWPPAGRKQEANQGQEWENPILAQLVTATEESWHWRTEVAWKFSNKNKLISRQMEID